jgi:hypothetical protein
MRKVFNNQTLDEQFRVEGYVVLPLLDKDNLKLLRLFYESAQLKGESGFYTTHFSKNREYKREEAVILRKTIQPIADSILEQYNVCFGSFMIKSFGGNSAMPLHADWTYVDEDLYISISFWMPLMDTNETNGTIGVVPRSHLIIPSLRGPNIPSPFHLENEYIISQFGKLLPMKEGEILIYDHRLLHYSPENKSQNERIAINIALVPNEAKVFHFCKLDDESTITKFSVNTFDFFIEYDNFKKPDLGLEEIKLLNPNQVVDRLQLNKFFKNKRKRNIPFKWLKFWRN